VSRGQAELLFASWFIGDGYGSQTEAMDAEEVTALIDGPISEVYTLEEHVPLCGMSGPTSDLTVLAGLSIIALERIDFDHIASKYRIYAKEEGFLSFPDRSDHSLALSRAPIFALLHATHPYTKWQQLVEGETRLTHPSPLARDAAMFTATALSLLVTEEVSDISQLGAILIKEVGRREWDPRLERMVRTAINQKPLAEIEKEESYTILSTLLVVLHTLFSHMPYDEAMDSLARRGGNSRLSCALYSALAALLWGEQSIPLSWEAEVFPSEVLEGMIKAETLFWRETIKMENLAAQLAQHLG
jgi:hypothetical protein